MKLRVIAGGVVLAATSLLTSCNAHDTASAVSTNNMPVAAAVQNLVTSPPPQSPATNYAPTPSSPNSSSKSSSPSSPVPSPAQPAPTQSSSSHGGGTTAPALPPPVPKAKVIVIDAGHGGPDSGAIGIGGVREKDLTLSYALAAQKALAARGYQVYLTRTTDTAVDLNTTAVEPEIRSRTALSKLHNASVYVSIHMNWYSQPSANGTETFYNNTNHREGLENPYPQQSILLAQTLEQHIVNAIHTTNRGSQDDELYNLITNTVPASLVEVGFISNQADLTKILDPNVKATFARAFADAIDAYFAQVK